MTTQQQIRRAFRGGLKMTNRELVQQIARMSRYSIDSSDDKLDDCVATMNRLIQEAKQIVHAETDHDDLPPTEDGRPKTKLFTVFIRSATAEGTIHIDTYEAVSVEDAEDQALEAVSADWCYTRDHLHVLGVAEGDVKILEWSDDD